MARFLGYIFLMFSFVYFVVAACNYFSDYLPSLDKIVLCILIALYFWGVYLFSSMLNERQS